jgi:hypothetical protein
LEKLRTIEKRIESGLHGLRPTDKPVSRTIFLTPAALAAEIMFSTPLKLMLAGCAYQ